MATSEAEPMERMGAAFYKQKVRHARGGETVQGESTTRTDGFLRGEPKSVNSGITAVTERLKMGGSHIEEPLVAVGGLFQYQNVSFVSTQVSVRLQ